MKGGDMTNANIERAERERPILNEKTARELFLDQLQTLIQLIDEEHAKYAQFSPDEPVLMDHHIEIQERYLRQLDAMLAPFRSIVEAGNYALGNGEARVEFAQRYGRLGLTETTAKAHMNALELLKLDIEFARQRISDKPNTPEPTVK